MTTVPTCADFTSARIVDRFDDMINPPGLTNHWATAQVDHDVVAIRSLNVPPVGQGDTITGQLYLGGRLARSYGRPVDVTWRPDRVERSTDIDGWRIETTTVCPPGEPAAAVQVVVTNSGDARTLRFGLWLASTVTSRARWASAELPQAPNELVRDGLTVIGRPVADSEVSRSSFGIQLRDGDEPAVSVQRLVAPSGATVLDGGPRVVEVEVALGAGESVELGYVHAIASTETEASDAVGRVGDDLGAAVAAAEVAWDAALAGLFDGSGALSGAIPQIETSNEAFRTLYHWGAMGTLWFMRDNPASVLGRSYDTLMPRYWATTTFIWDYSLSSQTHALMDPEQMRTQIAHWVSLDIDHHFGTEWLTGRSVGYWYSVNHYAMTRLVRDYVAFTQDRAFLDEVFTDAEGNARRLGDHVRSWARAWHRLRRPSGLADYGGIDNLLECVSSYTHEIASLNAANAWCMRVAAELVELEGGSADEAASLRAEADEVVRLVQELYIPGAGIFHTRQPDGSLEPTRHCYDFATVGTTIADDLPEEVRSEMVTFFDAELRSPSWLRALSPLDADAGYSLRADHQWNGAYPAWAPDAGRAAIALGGAAVVADWLPGLARSANQGPPGQGHFVEEAAEPIEGGARKSPPQWPYLLDWACSSAGSFSELVVSGVFGVEVALDGTVTAQGCLDAVDPDARLVGLRVGEKVYDIDANGVHERAAS
ncbi:hypothetical protein [Pseudactinotalea sp.]|uniref:hypothetical protein n=1 Tax=Pseudactinotalea sp. TaxID=1926260 RepID=UPI003B3B88B2